MAFEFLPASLWQYVGALAAVVGGLVVGKIVSFVIENYLKALAKKTKNDFDDVILDAVQGPLWVAFFIGGLYLGAKMLSLPSGINTNIEHVTKGLLILVAAWFVVRTFDSFLKHFVAPIAARTHSSLDDNIVGVVSQVGKGIIIVLAFLVMLSEFGFDVTAVVAGLGIGGVAIAFAAQATLSDAFGGLSIFFNKPFKVGDIVETPQWKGTVTEIGIRYSRIRNFDGRLLTVPNSVIARDYVINWSSETSRRVVMNLSLVYETSPEKIRQAEAIVQQIIRENPACAKDVRTGFESFNEYALNLTVIYYITNVNHLADYADPILRVKNEINLRILEEFNREKIGFAFPTQTVKIEKS